MLLLEDNMKVSAFYSCWEPLIVESWKVALGRSKSDQKNLVLDLYIKLI